MRTFVRGQSGATMKSITVTARWDPESGTWWTDGDDVPGLCVQGHSFEELSDAIFALAPDLLVANGAVRDGEPVEIVLIAEQRNAIKAMAAPSRTGTYRLSLND
jgi:predicted RNase H-like HicB family nuclease